MQEGDFAQIGGRDSSGSGSGGVAKARRALDEAITEFMRETGDGGEVVTGWVMSCSVKHSTLPSSDGYALEHSEGLPYHSQLGLLQAALDERRHTVLAGLLREDRER